MGQLTNWLIQKGKEGINSAQAKYEEALEQQQEKAAIIAKEKREAQARHLAEIEAQQKIERQNSINIEKFKKTEIERQRNVTYRDSSVHVGNNRFQTNTFDSHKDISSYRNAKESGLKNVSNSTPLRDTPSKLLQSMMGLESHVATVPEYTPREIRELALESAREIGVTDRLAIKQAEIAFKQKYGFKEQASTKISSRDSDDFEWMGLAQDQPLKKKDMKLVSKIERQRRIQRFKKELYEKYGDVEITVEGETNDQGELKAIVRF